MIARVKPVAEHVEKVVRKGQMIYVEGPIEVRDYTDKEGVERRSWQVKLQGPGQLRVLKWPRDDSQGNNGDAGKQRNNVFTSDNNATGQVYD